MSVPFRFSALVITKSSVTSDVVPFGSVTVNPIVPVPSLWISLFRGIYFELVSSVDHRLQTMARRKFLVACADKILQRAP
jgi:hypothetical protein